MIVYIVTRAGERIEQAFSSQEKAEVFIECMGEIDTEAHDLNIERLEIDSWEPKNEYSYNVYCRFTKEGQKIISAETDLGEDYKIPSIEPWSKSPDFTGCIINLSARYIEDAEEKAKPLFDSYLKSLKGN